MLANDRGAQNHFGSLAKDVHKPEAFRLELIDFIAGELPRWRDRADRPVVQAETPLTSQLCAHLNSASRHTVGWDILQFRVEESDEQNKGRKIDLTPAPSGSVIYIDGRRFTDFDMLMPIECKRFPIPTSSTRDEREYVFSNHSSTGGIQRFKAGSHGSVHALGAMIGYVQTQTNIFWQNQVEEWISALAASEAGWSLADLLQVERVDAALRLTLLRSSHQRQNNLPPIELRHVWIEM